MNTSSTKLVHVVEDDTTMRSLLKTLLEIEGFLVHVFSDVDQPTLISKIIEENPAVILLDINLKNLNGLEALSEIRKTEKIKDISVIISSGQFFEEEAFKAGATSFLLKPYMPNDLITLVQKYTQKGAPTL